LCLSWRATTCRARPLSTLFDVFCIADRIRQKSLPVIFGESLAVGEKPSLHQLNHPEHAIKGRWIDTVPLT